MNYSGYFLIVSDYINWGKIIFWRSGGSGQVPYSLEITDLDPLIGLIFERAINQTEYPARF